MPVTRCATTLVAVILVVCVTTAWQADPVVDWIRGSAIPLSTPEAGRGFSDLQPLKAVIGDARIVALGEATHGSREFFQLKHRLLEFLATEMGSPCSRSKRTCPRRTA